MIRLLYVRKSQFGTGSCFYPLGMTLRQAILLASLLLGGILLAPPQAWAAVAFRSTSTATAAGGSLPTRFYVQNAPADVTIATHRGAWDDTTSVLPLKLARAKSGAIATQSATETSSTNNYDVLLLKLVSEPVPTAQTISGTLDWVMGTQESATQMNAFWHVHVYVTQGNTNNLRGTLYSDYLGTSEWSNTARGDAPAGPLTLTPVAISANDRIVIEVGYQARNTSTTARTGTLWYGGTDPTDLTVAGDESSFPGWWEFSQDLFPSPPSFTLDVPAGTVADDLMVATLAVTPGMSIIAPSGWTPVQDSLQSEDAGSRLATWTRVATASEPPNYTWTFAAAHSGAVGGIASFSGVDPINPVVTSGAQLQNGDTATSHSAPGLSASAGDMLVTVHEYQSSGSWTPPAGMTEIPGFDISSGGGAGAGGVSLEMNYQLLTATGNTGAKTATASGNGDEGASQALVLRPVPLNCFNDDFNRPNGNPGTGWNVSSISGTFGAPAIFNNRLRLTNASASVSTTATLQRLFPGAGNEIRIEFDHFAYGGSGADGIAIALSDSSVSPVPGAFGGSLGYAQKGPGTDCPNCPGFAGGWLGVGIDEFGNFSNPTEGRSGGPGSRPDSVSVRGSGSGQVGYIYHAGTAANLNPQVDNNGSASPPHHYRIIVDHSNGTNAWVSVERDAGSGYVNLVGPYDAKGMAGQAAVPSDWMLSWTGSTGGSTNIHEIDNLQICAIKQSAITALHHLEIEHSSGTGLTCAPSTLTIRACSDATCSSLYADGVTGTLTATGAPTVNWVGGANFAIPAGSGMVTKDVRVTTPGSVVFGTQSGSVAPGPAGPSPTCNFGSPACTFTAADAGFVFDVPDHTADTVQNVSVAAVRKNPTTQQCVPGFQNVTKAVNFWSGYLNPGTGTLPARVNGTPVAGSSPGTSFNLNFDNGGVAPITVRYADVGRLRLNASFTGSGNEGGLIMTGADDFVARPARFVLTTPGNPAAPDANGGVFRRAGQNFTIQVESRNASDGLTPNFGRETPAEGVRLVQTLVAPVGGSNPALAGGFGPFGTACGGGPGTAGTACGTVFNWGEVGIFALTPGIGDGDYLGAGDVTGTSSGNIGRFIPARLGVGTNIPLFNHACVAGSFTYLGQEFDFFTPPVLTVTGRNAGGGITNNYGGAFWKLGNALAGRSYANAVGGTLSILSRTTAGGNATLAGTADFDGTGTLTVTGDGLTYGKPGVPEAPFAASVHLDLPAADLTDTDGACYDPDVNGACDGFRVNAIGGTELRWGRLALANAFGSDLLDLQVPMQNQYFNGAGFVLNPADSCTSGVTLILTEVNPTDSLAPADTCVHESIAGPPGASGLGCPGPGPGPRQYLEPPLAGSFNLWFKAPGAGHGGSLNLTALVPAWLQFKWLGGVDADPRARVSFGLFKGTPAMIYRRESVQ